MSPQRPLGSRSVRVSVCRPVLSAVVLLMGVLASRGGLICVSLVISDAEHLFLCLLAICVSCLQNVCSGPLPFF